MSSAQLTLIICLFAAVIVLSIIMITVSVLVRKRRMRAHLTGPGSPSSRVSTDPWERFGPALAAPYARTEWHRTRGAKRMYSPEQTYFGYGCVLPYPTLRSQLAHDWGVKTVEQAQVQVRNTVGLAAVSAAQYAMLRGESAQSLRARLIADGAPEQAADLIASHMHDSVEPGDTADRLLPNLAFDIARFANLARWAGCIGHLDYAVVRQASDVLGAAALTGFSSWAEFGRAYEEGLRGYTKRGLRPYLDAVEWLNTAPESPWKALAWPLAGSAPTS